MTARASGTAAVPPWSLAVAACRQAGFEPDVRYTSTDLQICLRLVERAWCAKQHATYRWLGIDVSRREAAPREPAHAPS